MPSNRSPEQWLDSIEQSEPLSVDSVDYDFTNPPEQLAETYGGVFRTIARIENDVPHNVNQIQRLLRHVSPTVGRFLGVWEAQEVPHGQILDEAQRVMGLEPYVPSLRPLGRTAHIGGELARVPSLRRVLTMIYLTRGAQHEQLTGVVYRKLHERLVADGEVDFARTAIQPIRPQEGGHYGFYSSAAYEQWQQMGQRERKLARPLIAHTYRPVGIENEAHERELSRVFQAIHTERNVNDFIRPVERATRDLLGDDVDVSYVAREITRVATQIWHEADEAQAA